MSERITAIIGAGLPLNLTINDVKIFPSTDEITRKVCEQYKCIAAGGNTLNIVKDIYDILMNNYPPQEREDWKITKQPIPKINFEMIFHVLESYWAYSVAWTGQCKNHYIYPVFAPFVGTTRIYDRFAISQIMPEYLMRIMDIVNDYNVKFKSNMEIGEDKWFIDFFKNDNFLWDVFNLNYDTVFENVFCEYEDGFISTSEMEFPKIFSPNQLFENPKNLSTINHLHGCINYYYSTNKDPNADTKAGINDSDLFKYESYDVVKNAITSRSPRLESNQNGEPLFAGPIITGLRKNDKLNCAPYDYYHTNLVESIIKCPRLLIVGYSFGDLYINQVIERMRAIHGAKTRVVIVDKWNTSILKKSLGLGEYTDLDNYFLYHFNAELGEFICKMVKSCNILNAMKEQLEYTPKKHILKSKDGCLMILPCGFKDAAKHQKEIFKFLKR